MPPLPHVCVALSADRRKYSNRDRRTIREREREKNEIIKTLHAFEYKVKRTNDYFRVWRGEGNSNFLTLGKRRWWKKYYRNGSE